MLNYFREWRVEEWVSQSQENEIKSSLGLPVVLVPSLLLFLLTPWLAAPPHPHFCVFPFSNNPKGMSHTRQPTRPWPFWLVSELPPATQPPHPSETWRVYIPPTGTDLPDGWATLTPVAALTFLISPWLLPILHSWDAVQTLLPRRPFLMSS